MYKLAAFADEISANLDEQLDVLESVGIQYIELRSVWNKNVLDLNDSELKKVKEIIKSRGFLVSSIASPVGKAKITEEFDEQIGKLKRAITIAKIFNTKYIRVFSFFIPQGEEPASYRKEVLKRLSTFVEMAIKEGIILLHENEKFIYGDNIERCLDIITSCNSPNLKLVFDPANFVQCGVKPYTDAYPLLEPYIYYVHIKDATYRNGSIVPPGQGDGEIPDLLNSLLKKGYESFFSLEPHLKKADAFKGFSGPELFRYAATSFKELVAPNNNLQKN